MSPKPDEKIKTKSKYATYKEGVYLALIYELVPQTQKSRNGHEYERHWIILLLFRNMETGEEFDATNPPEIWVRPGEAKNSHTGRGFKEDLTKIAHDELGAREWFIKKVKRHDGVKEYKVPKIEMMPVLVELAPAIKEKPEEVVTKELIYDDKGMIIDTKVTTENVYEERTHAYRYFKTDPKFELHKLPAAFDPIAFGEAREAKRQEKKDSEATEVLQDNSDLPF